MIEEPLAAAGRAGGGSVEPGQAVPVEPRQAATVLLLRDGRDGLEVYLLRRVRGMPFAGGMTAYPGGGVDVRDADADLSWTGPGPADWAKSFHCDERLARELVCAAVRETFEESGVLLASAWDGSPLDPATAEWEADRLALMARERSLSEVFRIRGVTLRADLLRPWAHWITPEAEPRRYDTKFFTAAVPAGQEPRDVSGEADEAAWVAVADALTENEQGTRMMLPPTLVTLTDLVEHATVAEVLAAAPQQPLTPVVPRLVVRDGTEYVEMPDGSLVKTPIRLGPGGAR